MLRTFTSASVLAAVLAFSAPAEAQWYPQYPVAMQPVYRPNPGIQYLGRLPNGTPVFNPWNMYNNQNYSGMPVYPVNALPWNYNPYWNLGFGYNPYPFGTPSLPVMQREPGRFIPVARDLAINPISGTRLAPYRGIALTNEGAFYRIPGTGSLTAWGAFIPGSGAYYNPVSGTVYNPGSGVIVRP